MSPPKPHRTSHRASRASRASRLRRKTLTTTPYKPPNQMKGIFAGSGLLLNIPCMAEQLVKLSGKAKEDCIVLYLGTASYDIELKTQNQTSWYEKNCKQLIVMNVVANAPKTSYMRYVIYVTLLLRREFVGLPNKVCRLRWTICKQIVLTLTD
jgi:hypothetical protein